ncbi:MAG: hypothetical protein QOI59_4406 [Gammaproteobacteria bacterium]|jgi:hypothetical protein|nr:hypothetical protein [Gammaproteobacteria bacterium]
MEPTQTLGSSRVALIATTGLISSFCLQTALAAEVDSEAVAQENWRQFMTHNPESAPGCFQAAYPNFVWERTECKVATPRVHPVRRQPAAGAPEVTGNGNDYVASAAGLISQTLGTFPKVTGVTSERGVGVAAFGGGGILGPNEYTLQINTNFTGTTSVCAGHSGCTVWQQFIYSPDYQRQGQAAVFMQYWLIGWGSSACPRGWMSAGGGDCFRNSNFVAAPDIALTSASLAKLTLSGAAVAGGNDTVVFNSGTQAYSVSGSDSVVDISAVWRQSEFNIVGNAGGSRANFNSGSSVTVKVALTDGSTAAPSCVAGAGSTGETNNLNLGACTTASGTNPSIQFTESN